MQTPAQFLIDAKGLGHRRTKYLLLELHWLLSSTSHHRAEFLIVDPSILHYNSNQQFNIIQSSLVCVKYNLRNGLRYLNQLRILFP